MRKKHSPWRYTSHGRFALPRKPGTSRPDHRRKTVLTYVRGMKRPTTMASREAAKQLGRSKGGQTRVALGVGHFWTSDTARAAALKSRQKGARRRSAKRRKALDYQAIRSLHTNSRPVYWSGSVWIRVTDAGQFPISQRTAMSYLGYRPRSDRGVKGLVPTQIISATPGSPFAQKS